MCVCVNQGCVNERNIDCLTARGESIPLNPFNSADSKEKQVAQWVAKNRLLNCIVDREKNDTKNLFRTRFRIIRIKLKRLPSRSLNHGLYTGVSYRSFLMTTDGPSAITFTRSEHLDLIPAAFLIFDVIFVCEKCVC